MINGALRRSWGSVIGRRVLALVALTALILSFSPQPTFAAGCGFGTAIAGGKCRGYLTSGSTWSVPADWNNTSNTIEVIGGGGGAGAGGATGCGVGGGGGGGGAYSSKTNAVLTAGATVSFSVGAAGTGGSTWISYGPGNPGGDTYICSSTSNCGSIAGSTVVVGAKAGGAGSWGAAGAGGAAASGVGSVKVAGGAGSVITAVSCHGGGGGGGGGAASAAAAGGNGTAAVIYYPDSGGSGGAGSGTGGGAGGAGDIYGYNGTAGGNGANWDATHGSGGGGGGGGGDSQNGVWASNGANAGLYGGGGGGGGWDESSGAGAGGNGTQGIIVITYTPYTAPPSPTCAISFGANPITSGKSTTLNWSSTNGPLAINIAPYGWVNTTSGSVTVSPDVTTTYTGTAYACISGYTFNMNTLLCEQTSSGSSGSQTFSEPGSFTFTVPVYTSMTVEVWGGGQESELYWLFGNFAGGYGGASSFNGSVIANGGGGGNLSGHDVDGGTASGGDLNVKGSPPVWFDPSLTVAAGGNAPYGGTGGYNPNSTANTNGAGQTPGGGGGAAGCIPGIDACLGGGSGGYAKKTYAAGALTPGTTIPITVGAGGMNDYRFPAAGDGTVKITWTGGTATATAAPGTGTCSATLNTIALVCTTPLTSVSGGLGYRIGSGVMNRLFNVWGYANCLSNTGPNIYFIPAQSKLEADSFWNAIPRLTGMSQVHQ